VLYTAVCVWEHGGGRIDLVWVRGHGQQVLGEQGWQVVERTGHGLVVMVLGCMGRREGHMHSGPDAWMCG